MCAHVRPFLQQCRIVLDGVVEDDARSARHHQLLLCLTVYHRLYTVYTASDTRRKDRHITRIECDDG